jgi:hypothetical protein
MGDGGSYCFTNITRDGRWFKKQRSLFAINPQYHHKRVV